MDCVNLLAFIQIAVAFDLGLLYLSKSHILTKILETFLDEKRKSYKILEKNSRMNYENALKHESLQVREAREKLNDIRNRISVKLNGSNISWDKYAYTGLFSGVYGILCLVLIGLRGCRYDNFIHNFLLISGELIVVYLIFNSIQLSSLSPKEVRIDKVINKLRKLAWILATAAFISAVGWYLPVFPSFNMAFVPLLTFIVYYPVIIYVFRFLCLNIQIQNMISKCEKTSLETKRLNSALPQTGNRL